MFSVGSEALVSARESFCTDTIDLSTVHFSEILFLTAERNNEYREGVKLFAVFYWDGGWTFKNSYARHLTPSPTYATFLKQIDP